MIESPAAHDRARRAKAGVRDSVGRPHVETEVLYCARQSDAMSW